MTCSVCTYPTSPEWVKTVAVRPTPNAQPFYSFLLKPPSPGDPLPEEIETVALCPFCHALLTAQWNFYEDQQLVPPERRQYIVNRFICAVCGSATYRKRVQALPFKDFPFLGRKRFRGSITLAKNTGHPQHTVACLDCSETLWTQNEEYSRMGLPLQLRQYNWMARAAPPEGSGEAWVARLPSGQKQFPKYLSVDPVSIPAEIVEEERSKFPPNEIISRGEPLASHLPPGSSLSTLAEISESTPSLVPLTPPCSSAAPPVGIADSPPLQRSPVISFAPRSTLTTLPPHDASCHSESDSSDVEIVYSNIITSAGKPSSQEKEQSKPISDLEPPPSLNLPGNGDPPTNPPPLPIPSDLQNPEETPKPVKYGKLWIPGRGGSPKTRATQKRASLRRLLRKTILSRSTSKDGYEQDTRTFSISCHSSTVVRHEYESSLISNVVGPPPTNIFPGEPLPYPQAATPVYIMDSVGSSQLSLSWPSVSSCPTKNPQFPSTAYWTHLRHAANATLQSVNYPAIDEASVDVLADKLCKYFCWESYGVYGEEERLSATRQCILEELDTIRNSLSLPAST